LRIGSGAAAADLGFVDDVVVNESGGVDDLDDGCELNCARALVAEELGGEEQKGGTDTLAAAGTKVFADLGDGGDIRDRVVPELLFDGDDVVAKQVEDLFAVNDRCAQKTTPSPRRHGVTESRRRNSCY
jgi:hypothetical protein